VFHQQADNVRVQVAARAAFKLRPIFDDGMARNRGSPATICSAAFQPSGNAKAHSTTTIIRVALICDKLGSHTVTKHSSIVCLRQRHRHVIQASEQRGATQPRNQTSIAATTGTKPRNINSTQLLRFVRRNQRCQRQPTFPI
jgi:hypothetical protein